MDQKLQEQLFMIEPEWFDRGHPQRSLMNYGFTVGDGWYKIVEDLLLLAKRLRDKYAAKGGENPFDKFEVVQAKEKFGALRFYFHGGDASFSKAVKRAMSLSLKTCEACGAPGKLGKNARGWYTTSCAGCRLKEARRSKANFFLTS